VQLRDQAPVLDGLKGQEHDTTVLLANPHQEVLGRLRLKPALAEGCHDPTPEHRHGVRHGDLDRQATDQRRNGFGCARRGRDIPSLTGAYHRRIRR
jgi:hypothetical protein